MRFHVQNILDKTAPLIKRALLSLNIRYRETLFKIRPHKHDRRHQYVLMFMCTFRKQQNNEAERACTSKNTKTICFRLSSHIPHKTYNMYILKLLCVVEVSQIRKKNCTSHITIFTRKSTARRVATHARRACALKPEMDADVRRVYTRKRTHKSFIRSLIACTRVCVCVYVQYFHNTREIAPKISIDAKRAPTLNV